MAIRIRKPRPQPRRAAQAAGDFDCSHVTVVPSNTNPGIGRCIECGATTWVRRHRTTSA